VNSIEIKGLEIIERIGEFVGDKPVVIGLSGGVDSALVATMLCDALPSIDHIIPVCMPSDQSPSLDQQCVDALVKELGLNEPFTIPIGELNSEFIKLILRTTTYDKPTALDRGNLSARLRMSILYWIAGHVNGLVAGTGNRTEHEIGYFTKWGDGANDFEPIASLWKCEVYRLARALGVPDIILDRPPSACLWEGQTDEEEFGMSYEQLDLHLDWLSGDYHPYTWYLSNKTKISVDTLKQVILLRNGSSHKKHMPPTL